MDQRRAVIRALVVRFDRLRGAALRGVDAGVFALAGVATCLTVLVGVDRELATVGGVLGSMLTLAGLFILSFGAADERPLRRVPVAQVLLMAAAVAGVLQTLALQAEPQVHGRDAALHLLVPLAGLAGGLAVAGAVVVLAAARGRHVVGTQTLVGLAVIAVSATIMNAVVLVQMRTLLAVPSSDDPMGVFVTVAVLASGVGQLVIAAGFWRSASRTGP